MTRSVVATGKVEPITKVEIKSKANGIIERLFVDVDQVVLPGQVLAELDKGYYAVVTRGKRQAEQVQTLPVDAELVILRRPIAGG